MDNNTATVWIVGIICASIALCSWANAWRAGRETKKSEKD